MGLPSRAGATDNRVAACTPDAGGRRRTKVLPSPTSLRSSVSEPPWRSASSRPTGTAAPRRDCLAVLQESAEFRRVEVVEIDLLATTGGRLEWI